MLKFLSARPTTALLLGILLIAASLRAPFTVLPPLLGPIAAAFDLSSVGAGALTTLPLIAFALISPLGRRIASSLGLERALAVALLAIVVGVGVRSTGSVESLFVGTTVIGMGVAVANVLLPSLVKRDFALHVASLTGAYVLAMNIAAGLGSAAVIPMADGLGWQGALLCFGVLPLIALTVWLGQGRAARAPAAAAAPSVTPDIVLWRSPLAWQVTLFLGLNSTINYVLLGWLPAILIDAGISPARAGSTHGIFFLASAVPALCLGAILRRLRDQRGIAVGVSLLTVASLSGLLLLPQYALFWAVLFGIGNGAGFVLGLSFIALRASHARQAAALSGMAQCVGYAIAAVGPMATGALHDASDSWAAPLILCASLGLMQSFIGVRAGRDRHIGARH